MCPKSQTGAKWLKLSISAPADLTEAAADLMGVLSGAGVEQSPEKQGVCTITGFFPLDGDLPPEETVKTWRELVSERMQELFSLYGQAPPSCEIECIDDEDWATSWKRFYHTCEIIPGLVLKPSWEEYQPVNNQQVIEMDPGMAFGTGQHASTRMALDLLAQAVQNRPGTTVLDVGTGTGILAMAGVLLGAGSAMAIDNDPEAVAVAIDNIRNNNLQQRIAVTGDDLGGLKGNYGIICANIVHDVLVDMAPLLRKLMAAQGFLVLAGVLGGEQENNITQVYQELGFTPVRTEHTDEWAALLFQLN